MTNLVLLMRLAVLLVPAGSLPLRGGRRGGRQARVGVEDMKASETSLSVARAKKGGRVATALKRRFRDQIGQVFSGGVSLIRDAIDLCDLVRYITSCLQTKEKCFGSVASNVTGATA